MEYKNRNCPICNSTSYDFIYEVALKAYDFHPLDQNYNVIACTTCGFLYNNTSVSQSVLDEYYKNQSKYESKEVVSVGSGGISELDKIRISKTVEKIVSYIPSLDSSILDIGCASGGLLQKLSDLGYVNLHGLDPSIICIDRVKKISNCSTFFGSITDDSLIIEKKFDVIILTHVLEHILDITSVFNRLISLLNDNGIIYIECPDASRYHINVHAPFQEFNTEHINHFTPSSYRNMSFLFGLALIENGNTFFKIENGLDYFVCFGLFKKLISDKKSLKKEDSIQNMKVYIDKSTVFLNKLLKLILKLEYKNIIFFGIGQLSYKLIKNVNESKNLIFFDNDFRNSNKTIYGKKIYQLNEISSIYDSNTCIVITSLISSEAIKRNILDHFNANGYGAPVIIDFKNI